MARPRILAFGYDELLLELLAVVTGSDAEVAGVVFPSSHAGDRRVQRTRSLVEERGLPVLVQPAASESTFWSRELTSLAPDLGLVWSYPMILTAPMLEAPRFGCVNLHMGLLPEYRGPNGLQAAIVNGETTTGVTLHYMDTGVDTGPLLAQARFPIGSDEDIAAVLIRAKQAGVRLLGEGLPHLTAGKLRARRQDEASARYYPRRTEAENQIDWSRGSREICNLVRALTRPYDGAFTFLGHKRIVVLSCHPSMDTSIGTATAPAEGATRPSPAPGEIHAIDAAGLHVAIGDGMLLVNGIEVDDCEVTGSDLVRLFAAGDRLG